MELQQTLVEMLDPTITEMHFAKRMISYTLPPSSEPTSPITLHFEDGSTATCDVLLGADGIHSATRRVLLDLAASDAEQSGGEDEQKTADALRGFIDPIWTGAMIYRGVVPRENLEKINPNHSILTHSQIASVLLLFFLYCFAQYKLISLVFGERKGTLVSLVLLKPCLISCVLCLDGYRFLGI